MTISMMTGSREITESDKDAIYDAMVVELLEIRPEKFFFGGARGSDTFALEAAAELKKEANLKIELMAVVPWTVDEQPVKARAIIEKNADKVIELNHNSQPGSCEGYFARNKWMVNKADRCRVFWNGDNGGTKRTAELAREADLHIRVTKLGKEALAEIKKLALEME